MALNASSLNASSRQTMKVLCKKCSTTRVAHFHVTDRMDQNFLFSSVKDMAEHLGLTVHQLRGTLYNGAQKQRHALQERQIGIYKLNKDGTKSIII